jgi:hypothetical protein
MDLVILFVLIWVLMKVYDINDVVDDIKKEMEKK